MAFAGSPPRPSAGGSKALGAGKAPLIEVRDDRLTVKLHGLPWAVVLKELQRQTGLAFRVQGQREETVTVAFEDLPLEQGLRRLFRNTNLIFLYTGAKDGQGSGSRLAQVWILPRGEGSLAETGQAPQRPLRDQEAPLRALPRHAPAPKQGQEPGSEGKALIEALQDPDNGVRERAVEALGGIASPWAIKALGMALENESAAVRERAVEALVRLGGERAIDALKRALQNDDANVREAASDALWQLTGKRASE